MDMLPDSEGYRFIVGSTDQFHLKKFHFISWKGLLSLFQNIYLKFLLVRNYVHKVAFVHVVTKDMQRMAWKECLTYGSIFLKNH